MDDMAIKKEVERQFEILRFGVTEITPEDEFKAMLYDSIKNEKPLRVKCGIDPTAADVHLGHLVPYRKMRQFQELGHIGVVVIGDYTARIGDPTGKNESRPSLDADQVKLNAKDYLEQVYTVLDRQRTEVRIQTDWFEDKNLSDILKWAGQVTVAKLLSHETFKDRLDTGNPLGLHELFYPVLQGVDSVYVDADVELGGSDQKFNVLMGRDFQKSKGQRPQIAMLLPIVTGLDGNMKMSKSLKNYIGVMDDPFDKFGKTMSIPDNIMVEYYKYIANFTTDQFLKMKSDIESNSIHPNEAKKQLATRVVELFHGEEVAVEMRKQFEAVFAKGKVPDDIDEFELKEDSTLISVLVESGLLKSNGEVRRMVKQNAVGIVDGKKLTDALIGLDESFKGKVIKVGKRKFIKIV